jgi:hypothetical protein
VDTRVEWTFTPNLSLQLFAQPFVSAGRYERFKEFGDAGTCACPEAEPARGDAAFITRFGDPDFTFRSLRSNAVLRSEYRPGSALFFVWQQDRSGFLPFGDFDFGRDYGALFCEPARNVFLVKATYWIGG